MTTENSRAAVANIIHSAAMTGKQLVLMGLLISWSELAQDMSQFYHGGGAASGDKSAISWSMTATALDWASRVKWV